MEEHIIWKEYHHLQKSFIEEDQQMLKILNMVKIKSYCYPMISLHQCLSNIVSNWLRHCDMFSKNHQRTASWKWSEAICFGIILSYCGIGNGLNQSDEFVTTIEKLSERKEKIEHDPFDQLFWYKSLFTIERELEDLRYIKDVEQPLSSQEKAKSKKTKDKRPNKFWNNKACMHLNFRNTNNKKRYNRHTINRGRLSFKLRL